MGELTREHNTCSSCSQEASQKCRMNQLGHDFCGNRPQISTGNGATVKHGAGLFSTKRAEIRPENASEFPRRKSRRFYSYQCPRREDTTESHLNAAKICSHKAAIVALRGARQDCSASGTNLTDLPGCSGGLIGSMWVKCGHLVGSSSALGWCLADIAGRRQGVWPPGMGNDFSLVSSGDSLSQAHGWTCAPGRVAESRADSTEESKENRYRVPAMDTCVDVEMSGLDDKDAATC